MCIGRAVAHAQQTQHLPTGGWLLLSCRPALLPEVTACSVPPSTRPPAVNCHRHEDQSRRDDLWGWFYCLVELVEGEEGAALATILLACWIRLYLAGVLV